MPLLDNSPVSRLLDGCVCCLKVVAADTRTFGCLMIHRMVVFFA